MVPEPVRERKSSSARPVKTGSMGLLHANRLTISPQHPKLVTSPIRNELSIDEAQQRGRICNRDSQQRSDVRGPG